MSCQQGAPKSPEMEALQAFMKPLEYVTPQPGAPVAIGSLTEIYTLEVAGYYHFTVDLQTNFVASSAGVPAAAFSSYTELKYRLYTETNGLRRPIWSGLIIPGVARPSFNFNAACKKLRLEACLSGSGGTGVNVIFSVYGLRP